MSSFVEQVAKAIEAADIGPTQDKQYNTLAIAALKGFAEALREARGDPRLYGQGFHDPYAGTIYQIEQILDSEAERQR